MRATLPNCGSGFVLARAGKALDARDISGVPQPACDDVLPGAASGAASFAPAQAGNAATITANSKGLFIRASVEKPILAKPLLE